MAQRHKSTIRAAIWPLLGTMTDACLATQYAIAPSTVQHWRIQAKIAPYRHHGNTRRNYRAVLQHHPEGLTAQQVATTLGRTRQAAFLMLHALARREVVEYVMRPNSLRYGGRAHLMVWRLAASSKENTHHAQTD